MQKRISTAITSCLLAASLASGAAMAQQATTGSSLPAATVPAPDYSDAQLERFVSASQKVVMLSQEYTPKLQAAPDEPTKQKVFEEADQKMVKAVHDEGMTVDQFNGINQALQQDPKLAQRVKGMVK